MSSLATVLVGMTATSLLVAFALAMAWLRFGRDRHAALWTAGFLASSAGHTAQLIGVLLPGLSGGAQALAVACLLASMALLAHGFLTRAGHSVRSWLPLLLMGCAMVLAGMGAWFLPGTCLPRVVVNLFAAAMMAVSAIAVREGQAGSRAAGPVAFWWLLGFAAYCALLAGVASLVSDDGPITGDVYRFLFMTGVPTGMTGIGLVALLLLGGDLAERLHRLAEVDPLTGVLNRRGIEHAALRMIAIAKRGGRPLAIAVADLDRFKAINDGYGHALGDIVLKRFAAHAAAQLRGGDLIGRLGGEEFVFVLADTGAARAAEAMDRLRDGLGRAVADLDVEVKLTASFGIATLGDRSDTLETMLERADEALYRSKHEGRDRVSLARPQHQPGNPRFQTAWLRPTDAPGRIRDRVG